MKAGIIDGQQGERTNEMGEKVGQRRRQDTQEEMSKREAEM